MYAVHCALRGLVKAHCMRKLHRYMVATASPADNHYDNTLRTLRSMDRFRRVATWPEPRPNAHLEFADKLQAEIRRLKGRLDDGRWCHGW